MDSNIALFSELEPDDVQLIADCGVERKFSKGTVIINEGDESDAFYVIKSGKVKIYASDKNGKEIILNMQGQGEYFGELSLIDPAPRSASVITMDACCLTVVSRAHFERCLQINPRLALKMMAPLVQRIRLLTQNVKNLALLDVYGRVARTLLDLADERDGILVIEQRLTHQDLANMVGASREMVSRIMKDLVAGNYIRLKDKRITIPNKLPSAW